MNAEFKFEFLSLVALQLLFLFINNGMKWNVSPIILFSPLLVIVGSLIIGISIWKAIL